ncbi:MAG: hypothetical protein VX798_09960 [Bacteroidota bacterium]|uniref:Uncharacterized protein n=1 Tax=Flagellimonas profundi TaxID=2915620 RepID=A0ABS3FAX1_9FLAO|nr:hypothetical protein [Allomuricauda profundi]MBO0340309.1 hypothetical protein [Allomuricauda profundi]MEC7771499.1 hypothetical protein [Bacteroidota bacterium]
MKNLNSILNRITALTNTIESQYPELYRFLDENPMTLPLSPHPQVDKKALEGYLESLQQLLEHHQETHKKGVQMVSLV